MVKVTRETQAGLFSDIKMPTIENKSTSEQLADIRRTTGQLFMAVKDAIKERDMLLQAIKESENYSLVQELKQEIKDLKLQITDLKESHDLLVDKVNSFEVVE